MAQLTLSFLGNPTIKFEGQTLIFPTRQTLALLIYLVVEGGTHRRDKLATLFWPHYEPGQARAVLRTTLARLRKALGSAGPYLIVTPDTLGFDSASPFELDLHLLQAATQVIHRISPPPSILQQAVALYRGDFLEGFSLAAAPDFDDWVTFQRESWHYRVGLVFERLSQWQAEAGDPAGAIDTARRWVAHHPFDESAHRRLMQLYFAAGDRSAALQAFETCGTLLQKELNLSPGPETVALAERIRTTTDEAGGMRDEFGPRPSSFIPHPSSFTTLPLVGRAAEHAQLVAAYYAVCHGQTQAVVLIGEAGVGKTRLATEFQRWAVAQGAEVLAGRTFETGGRLPYQPLVQALRPRLEQENAPDDLLADVWLTELSRLLPELWDRYPDLPVPSGEDIAAQGRLFEAVARLVEAWAHHRPLILFIDDLQWADAASLDLLRYAANHWAERKTPLLLLLSLRREALDRGGPQTVPALLDWLAGLQRDLPFIRLTLEALTLEDTVRLVERLGGGAGAQGRNQNFSPAPLHPRSPAAFAQWLFRETGGQPFFMAEAIKALIERGWLPVHSEAAGRQTFDIEVAMARLETEQVSALILPGVQALILGQLASLSPAAFTLLAAGAVLGQDLEFSQLCRVAGLSEDEGLHALDEGLAAHLLRPLAHRRKHQASPLYAFSHDQIRNVVYMEAGDARRAIFHRRAYEVLQAAAASPALLAHHALNAGLLEAAFNFSLAAGDETLRLFAVRDAIAHYEQALTLMTRENELEPGQTLISTQRVQSPISNLQAQILAEYNTPSLPHLYRQLGRAYELDHQFEPAQRMYEAMLAFAEAADEPELKCESLTRLASVALLGKIDLDRAKTFLFQAQEVAMASGNRTGLAEIEWNLAQVNFYGLSAKAVLSHGEQALALARGLDLPDLAARSLNVMAYGELILGRWPNTEQHAQEGQALFAALGNRAMEVDCMCQVAVARINSGRLQAGIDIGQAAQAVSLEIENTWGQVHSAMQLAPGLLDIGQYEAALTLAQQAVTLAQAHTIHMLPMCLIRLASVYRTLLDLDTAHSVLLEAQAANEKITPHPFSAALAAEFCAVKALAGSWVEAHTYAQQLWPAKEHSLLYTGFTCWFEIEALLRAGEAAEAEARLHYFSQRAKDNPRLRLAYWRALAAQAQWQGHQNQVIDYLEKAGALAEEIGLPGEQWQIMAALAALYQLRGEAVRAGEALKQAAKMVQALAARIDNEGLRAAFLAAEPMRRVSHS